jgi:hypothetical protein
MLPIVVYMVLHAVSTCFAFRTRGPDDQERVLVEGVLLGFVIPFGLATLAALQARRRPILIAAAIALPSVALIYVSWYEFLVNEWSKTMYVGGFLTIKGLVRDPLNLSHGPFDPGMYQFGIMTSSLILGVALAGGLTGWLFARKRASNNSVQATLASSRA